MWVSTQGPINIPFQSVSDRPHLRDLRVPLQQDAGRLQASLPEACPAPWGPGTNEVDSEGVERENRDVLEIEIASKW